MVGKVAQHREQLAAGAERRRRVGRRVARRRGRRRPPRAGRVRPHSRIMSPSRSRASGPSGKRLGRDVDRRRHLAAGARHAPVGDQRDAMAAVLEHAERRGQLVQLGHAVGARALEADHHDDVAVELAGLERREHLVLVGEAAAPAPRSSSGPRSTALVLKIARPRLPSTSRMPPSAQERVAGRPQHVEVGAGRAVSRHTSSSPSSRGWPA